jgi:hypothetical protein
MRKKRIFRKTASILAFIIGAMAIFAGGKVILGQTPDYYVIDWVPIYNFTAGMITFFFTAILIWKNSKAAFPAAIATLTSHTIVMSLLQTAYRDTVAPDSLQAMTIRITVWIVILSLMVLQAWDGKGLRKNKIQAQELREG